MSNKPTINPERMISIIIKELANYKIEPTLTDSYIFKKNIEADYVLRTLNQILDNIEKFKSLVGQEVYKIENGFSYLTESEKIDETYTYTKIIDTPIVFTEDLFIQWIFDYIDFIKTYITKEIIQSRPFSTSPLSNTIEIIVNEKRKDILNFFENNIWF